MHLAVEAADRRSGSVIRMHEERGHKKIETGSSH